MPKEIKIGSTVFTQVGSGSPTSEPKLSVCPFGFDTSGKTRLIATAPDPIGVVPLDRKSRRTIETVAQRYGKTVFMPKEDFIRFAKPMEIARMKEPQAKSYYAEHVQRVMDAAYALHEHKDVRTVGIDPGTQLFEDIMFMHFGRRDRIMPRDRGPANQTMIDFLNAMTSKHLIVTHRIREIWKDDKPTGKYEPEGFNKIGFYTTVTCEMKRNRFYESAKGGSAGYPWQFSMDIVSCQDKAMLQGPDGKDALTDAMISFPMLAQLIYGDDDGFKMEDWGWNEKMEEELAESV